MKKLKRKIRSYIVAILGGLMGIGVSLMAGAAFASDPMAAMACMALVGVLLSSLLPKKCGCCG